MNDRFVYILVQNVIKNERHNKGSTKYNARNTLNEHSQFWNEMIEESPELQMLYDCKTYRFQRACNVFQCWYTKSRRLDSVLRINGSSKARLYCPQTQKSISIHLE